MNSAFDYGFDYGFAQQEDFRDKYPNLLKIDEAVANCASVVKISDRDYPYVRQWIYQAALKLGVSDFYETPYRVLVDGYRIQKPPTTIKVKSLHIYNEEGNMLDFTMIAPGKSALSYDTFRGLTVSEGATFFTLDTTHKDADNAAYAVMSVESLPIDDEGNVMVEEQNIDAFQIFVKYMIALRDDNPMFKEYNRMFNIKARSIRAENKMPSPIHAAEIVKRMNSMVQKFNPYYFKGGVPNGRGGAVSTGSTITRVPGVPTDTGDITAQEIIDATNELLNPLE